MPSLSRSNIAAFRLTRSLLIDGQSHPSPSAVARALCGAQAQVLSSGEMSVGIRSRTSRTSIVQAQRRHGTLVKTWAMRGTLHLLAANDLSLYVAALGAHAWEWRIARMSEEGIKRIDSERLLEACGNIVSDVPQTRKEISAIAAEQLGAWVKPYVESGWGGIMNAHCRVGNAVFGPQRGAETTFVRRDSWVRSWKSYTVESAQEEIARRYFAAYGPASTGDFAFWLGAKMPFVNGLIGRIRDELVEITIDDQQPFVLRKDLHTLRNATLPESHVRLLPHFDTYLLAHRRKVHLIADRHYKSVFRNAGWISPTILVDGRIAGTWEMKRTGKGITVQMNQHHSLRKEQRTSLRGEIERVKQFFDPENK